MRFALGFLAGVAAVVAWALRRTDEADAAALNPVIATVDKYDRCIWRDHSRPWSTDDLLADAARHGHTLTFDSAAEVTGGVEWSIDRIRELQN